MKPIIYYRPGIEVTQQEVDAMQRNFHCVTSRMKIEPNDLCIAKYSALPFYKELEEDLNYKNAKLINTYRQHRYIADLGNYIDDLAGLIPMTWRRLEEVPEDAFPIIVKGETNSKKFLWDTHMFAKDRRSAIDVLGRLQDDGLVCDQWMYFRKFVPLNHYLIGLRGLPVAKEFRVFVCNNTILSKGYYWTNYIDDLPMAPDANEIPEAFLLEVINRIGKNCMFYAVDVAQMENGNWIVIELNDGQMSGLSGNDPEILYANLAREVAKIAMK